MAEQLIFDLPARPALGREDFFVSDGNAVAVATLAAVDNWPLSKQLLIGEDGSGKTHLAHVWAAETGARILSASDLHGQDMSDPQTPIVVEDADRIAARPDDEVALFHLHNVMLERRLPLLVTARSAPRGWGITLPDLASRMQGTSVVQLPAPDEQLLGVVMLKLFADRQLQVAPNLVEYLLRRMDRSFAAARQLVEELDRAALTQNRAVTRPLARAVLDKLHEGNA